MVQLFGMGAERFKQNESENYKIVLLRITLHVGTSNVPKKCVVN